MTLVSEVMTHDVHTCTGEQTVLEVAKVMASLGRGLMVIVDAAYCPVGVVTDTDIIRRIVIEGRDPKLTPVSKIMSKNLISILPQDTVTDAAQKMSEYRIKRLPVVENNRLVGIISHKDLLETFISYKKKLLDLAIGF